jgi:hypothetical protein
MFWRKIEGKMTAEKDHTSHLEIVNRSSKEEKYAPPLPSLYKEIKTNNIIKTNHGNN